MPISATIICDSIATNSPRLTTFQTEFHQIILAERNRHRGISISDSSTRAISTLQYIDQIKTDPAMPIEFRKRIKGMTGGEILTGAKLHIAQQRWRASAETATDYAFEAYEAGEAKETVNARLLPYIYTRSIMTATEPTWMNFFGLRLGSDARPEIRALAETMWKAYNESKPNKLNPGEWHLPLCEDVNRKECSASNDDAMKVSAARCARQSFNTTKTFTIEEDLALYNRLVSNRHYSPLEHQATPDQLIEISSGFKNLLYCWEKPQFHGNLSGWIQHRKLMTGENLAPLPEGYVYEHFSGSGETPPKDVS